MGTKAAVKSKNGAREYAESTFTGLNLDPSLIEIESGFNARNFNSPENKEHVAALAESIKAQGVQVPLKVRFKDGKFYLVDGESRFRAVQKLLKEGVEIKTIPAIQETKNVSEDARVASLLTHNSGKRLNQLEQGEVFSRLRNYGWTDIEIAAKTGITGAHVANIMLLHGAPPAVKKAVVEGKVAPTLAIQVVRDHGDKAAEVIKEAVNNAVESGKDKATAKHVTAEPTKTTTRKKSDPFSDAFSKTGAKAAYAALTDIYFNIKKAELSTSQVQGICRNVFEDKLGSDWKTLITEIYDNEVATE